MTSLIEVDQAEDSGVSSSGATPEGQATDTQEVITTAAVKMEEERKAQEEERTTKETSPKPSTSGLSLSIVTQDNSNDDDIEDDEDIDESLLERIAGLSEMFPQSLRKAGYGLLSGTTSLIKGSYGLTCKAVWVAVSTSVILFAPVMFELERLNVEEMMKQDRNRLVLGPGSAMSGPPTSGIVPPPPTR